MLCVGLQEASREELISTIKRYAEEISGLKWKLAEKDAQLMGGFGACVNQCLFHFICMCICDSVQCEYEQASAKECVFQHI